ncbi:MAG: NepR family anti-sigma factor [Caulobacteraceae bacterium]|nr:NepR family anti-sigma factor [Caulobacteraceae bacterium]
MDKALDWELKLRDARITQHAIALRLRGMLDPVVHDPVPEEFLEILRRADQREGHPCC